jgi:hypothetical protein
VDYEVGHLVSVSLKFPSVIRPTAAQRSRRRRRRRRRRTGIGGQEEMKGRMSKSIQITDERVPQYLL